MDEGGRDHRRLIAGLTPSGKYRHARVNYANGDMVGHTGVRVATVAAVAAVDLSSGGWCVVSVDQASATRCIAIVTADHGNLRCSREGERGGRTPRGG